MSRAAYRELVVATSQILDQIAVFELDASKRPELDLRLEIKAIPALLVFAYGVEIKALLGFYSRDELERQLQCLLTGSVGEVERLSDRSR